MSVETAPTTETGYAAGVIPTTMPGAGRPEYVVQSLDNNGELRFPYSAVIYDRMRREDGQVGSILRAITQPILGTKWTLVGDDVDPAVLAFVESELGLGERTDGKRRRRREGIVWHEHLRNVLLMLPFGFMPFEQVYTVGPAAPGQDAEPGRLYAHLRKLAPRMPRTLSAIKVARDGGLEGIVQLPAFNATSGLANFNGVTIPADRLVMYVNDREGADWSGTSVLRTAYKHWLLKDALIRLGAQIVERNGMGVPVVEHSGDVTTEQAMKVARGFRAGAEAGATFEKGKMSVTLLGVTGSTVDPLPWVNYHDQGMSRSLLAMFLDLGHDNGARALGDTFVGIFLDSLAAVIDNVAETTTEYVIRDLVELNFGPDVAYPALVGEHPTPEATADAVAALTTAGVITPDAELEGAFRTRYGLPAKPDAPTPAPPAPDALDDAPTPGASLLSRVAALAERAAAIDERSRP